MCGIAGTLGLNGAVADLSVLGRMGDALAHRGPDDEGQYADGRAGLACRRLAILDLSSAGHQPMSSEAGDAVLAFNGEIYNFRELRRELEQAGHRFRSVGDTEVVLRAYEEWGSRCVERLQGMFALAVWDARRNHVFLARDRFGVKPLYWFARGELFAFASEVKALLAHPDIRAGVCYPALAEYFTFQNVFSDLTLFDGIRLLPPGCTLTVDDEPVIERYWDYPFPGEPAELDAVEAAEQVRALLVRAIDRQLVSDVPVGSYLSGGIDSSAITSVAARALPRLRTFTGGFDLSSASGLELGFDERAHAEHFANLFKTEHYEVVLHAGDMEAVLPELVWHLEDLRVGQSYPNYYVARLASRFATVVLSGAGGDELFGGYPWRYFRAAGARSREDFLAAYYAYWQRLTTDEERGSLFGPDTTAHVGDHAPYDVFRSVFDGWTGSLHEGAGQVNASLYFELKTFLPGLLLVEDKVSMAHSLETRVPFLDEDLVELACRIPPGLKLSELGSPRRVDENLPGKRLLYDRERADGKTVLRDAVRAMVPEPIPDRTKQGFSAPDASWFRGESIEYINRLLRTPQAALYEFLDRRFVERVLDEHLSGRVNRRLLIWSFLSFEWWCRLFLAGEDLDRERYTPVTAGRRL